MQVYIALEQIDYEGFYPLGVFADQMEAEAFIQRLPAFHQQYAGHSYGVVVAQLGQAIEDAYSSIYYVELAE